MMFAQTLTQAIPFEEWIKVNPDLDKGEKKCIDCNGEGEVECPRCGNGMIECPECGGGGKVVEGLNQAKDIYAKELKRELVAVERYITAGALAPIPGGG